MNCRNCGMPLTGSKCEYCGTDYSAELGLVLIAKQDPPRNFDAEPCILFANEEPIAIFYDGTVWDADRIQTTPLNDTTLTPSSVWRWNV